MKGSAWTWGVSAALLVALPLVFRSGFAMSLFCQAGIVAIFALSYNMLLGQTGLLSFGHAVYYGLGALFTIHALNFAAAGWHLPVTLMPLVGAMAGLAFGIVLGYITTRRAGTTFAMISLGVGEMVAACSLMFPGFFGGEAGISANRTLGEPFLGITYGRRSRCTTSSPRGCWLLPRRCTPSRERRSDAWPTPCATIHSAQFVGDPNGALHDGELSGFFASLAGAAALNHEIVSSGLSQRTRRALCFSRPTWVASASSPVHHRGDRGR